MISRKIAESFYALHKSLIPPQQHIKPNIILRFLLFFSSSLFHLLPVANQIARDFKCFILADYRRFITLNVTQLHSTKPEKHNNFFHFFCSIIHACYQRTANSFFLLFHFSFLLKRLTIPHHTSPSFKLTSRYRRRYCMGVKSIQINANVSVKLHVIPRCMLLYFLVFSSFIVCFV